jgi:predicted Zn-dependent peptidase
VVIEDYRLTAPQLRMGWIGAAYDDPDRMALLALASTLSLGRFAEDGHLTAVGVEPPTSLGRLSKVLVDDRQLGRLSKVLVDDRQLATRVIANDYDLQHSGVFAITVFPRPGASLTTIENVVDSVIADLRAKPVTPQELSLFNAYNSVYLPTTLQPHFMRADTLAHDEIFAGSPTAYARQANAALSLKPADIDRAAKRFLGPARVVMSIVPAGKLDLIAKPEKPYVNITPTYAVQKR